ncbi:MAG TPA: metalloregulator ArsR/SmtB family transcription factor [Microvirga sp.]|jgi:DNA-binding transcriptional ArsR family regulator|nr:metalloregulator ArsR/SmtB family transcription factor [Microvirga sp.]
MPYQQAIVALADPTRRAVFEAVARGPASVAEIARGFPVSRPAVSQHLKVLKDAGLVQERPQGTRRIYAVRLEGLEELRAWLDQFWDETLKAYADSLATWGEDDER